VSALAAVAVVMIGAALFALVRGIATALDAEHAHARGRLQSIHGTPEVQPQRPSRRIRARRRTPSQGHGAVRQWLRRAGLAWEPADLAGISLGAGMSIGVVAYAVSGGAPNVAVVFGILGGLAPAILVRRRVGRRSSALNAQVVETLEVVSSSLRAGFGFTQSLDLASREQDEPISGELRQTIREINLGAATDEALQRLSVRTGDADLELAINAVVIQRKVGGDLSEILSNIAHMIRERIRIRGEINTLTAQARMSAWIVGLLPVALAGVLSVIQPEQMRMLTQDPAGRMLVVGAIALQLIGFFLVRRVAAIEY
jgi:tight adherence protein B